MKFFILSIAVALMFFPLNAQNYCLDFDGDEDYVNIGNDSSLDVGNVLTIEAWVKPVDLSGRYGIYSTRLNNSSGGFQLEIGTGNAGTNRVAVTGLNTWVAQTNDNAIILGVWNHIVYTRSGAGAGTHKIYVNGVEQVLISDSSYGFINNTTDKVIASGTIGGGLLNGKIDEVRIWNVVRTEQEINDNMYNSLLGTETGLVAYYELDEGTGSTAGDKAGNNNGTLINMDEADWVLSTLFAPILQSFTPSDNSLDIYPNINLEMSFDRNILAGEGNIEIYKVSDDSIFETIAASSCTIVDSIVTINPVLDFELNSSYYVLIDSTAFMSTGSAYFRGIVDKTEWNYAIEEFLITSLYPLDDATEVALDENLEIVFNRNIFAGAGNVTIYHSLNDSTVETFSASSLAISDSIVTIDPSNDLEYFTDYYVLIDSTAFMNTDSLYFGGILDKMFWNFRTLDRFTDINAGLQGVSESSVAWGDYDNDGDLDILLTGHTGLERISKIYNNDSGSFTDINAYLYEVSNGSVAWGDYDNDGDLDILLTGHTGGGAVSRIFNNDSGLFIDIWAGLTDVAMSSAACGDYDNDGDLDISIDRIYRRRILFQDI